MAAVVAAALTVLAGCAGPGAWTAEPVPVPSSPAGTALAAAMEHVECPEPEVCIAVGAVQAPDGTHVATWRWDGTSWAAPVVHPTPSGPLTQLDCPTTTFCVATGRAGVEVWDGSSWRPTAAGAGALAAPPTSVACATATYCVAVGPGGTTRWDGTTWQAAGPGPTIVGDLGPSTFRDVSCPDVGICLAIGNEVGPSGTVNVEHLWQSGAWFRLAMDELPTGTTIDHVDCGPGGPCVVVGRHADRPGGVAYGGLASQWHDLGMPPASTGGALSVECAAEMTCVVLRPDGPGAVLRPDAAGGSMGPDAWIAGPATPPGSALDVACASHRCVVVGGRLDATGRLQPESASVTY